MDIDLLMKWVSDDINDRIQRGECQYGPPPTIEHIETKQQGWIPKGDILEFAGRKIPGMVYFGKPETYDCYSCGKEHDSGVYINPVLPLAKAGQSKKDFILLNFAYHSMSPGLRSQFLDWHANGRSDPKCNHHFPLNFFFGLERRFFKGDSDDQERKEILKEIDRLLKIYGRDKSINSRISEFKKFASPTGARPVSLKDNNSKLYELLLKTRNEWEKSGSDLPLNAHLSQRAFKEALKLGLIKSNYIEPYSEQLFKIRFDRNFPNGIDITERKKPSTVHYRSRSNEFRIGVPYSYKGGEYFEFKKLRREFKTIFAFGEKVDRELSEYSKFVNNHPEKAKSFEAVQNLPLELWAKSGPYQKEIQEHLSGLADWARKQVESGTTLGAREINLNLNRDVWKERLNCNYRDDLSLPLALCGFGIAPDFCLRYQAVQEDEPVMFYKMQTKYGLIDEETESYRKALTEFAVGAYALNTENRPIDESEKLLSIMISKRKDLTRNERNRLNANVKCALVFPHDKGFLRRVKKSVSDEWKLGTCQFLVNLAHMEGMTKAKTISTIEKIYPMLGLDPAEAYADLHAGSANSAVKHANGNGAKVSEMDDTRIESIRSDTQKVSEVLGGIFTTEEEAKNAPKEAEPRKQLSDLDSKHATLLQKLLEREFWPLDEFEVLARNHGLLSEGAVETINEWTFEKYEDLLLDNQDGYQLSTGIADQLRSEFNACQ